MSSHTSSSMPLGHAVVVGASMAGLLAARVLAGHAQRVTIVEKDGDINGHESRKGVPQGRHVHALLAGGARKLSQQPTSAGRLPRRSSTTGSYRTTNHTSKRKGRTVCVLTEPSGEPRRVSDAEGGV